MKKIIPVILYAIMFATVLCIPLSVHAKTKVATPARVRVRSSESKRLKVTWNM